MATDRNWREFNDEWRDKAGDRAPNSYITAVGGLLLAAEPIIKRLDPFNVLLAAAGLLVSLFAFLMDQQDRKVEQRLRAWDIVTKSGPINAAKREALELLVANGMDLSTAKLSGARLAQRNFSGFTLNNVDLKQADLSEASLSEAKLYKANLSEAGLLPKHTLDG